MPLFRAVLLALFACSFASGQNYTISTIAGGGSPINGPATSASLGPGPSAVAADASGNLFLADGNMILRLDAATAILTLFAGSTQAGFAGDNGPANSAQFSYPQGLAFDSAGSLYVADSGNHRVRKISNGVITTVAGDGTHGFSGDDGPATDAQLYAPVGIAIDSAGDLYIADSNNGRIRKVANGVITTVAGNGIYGFSGDNGPASGASLAGPEGVAVDSAGNVYIADSGNNRVRKVANSVITTVAGNGAAGFSGDNGPATNAQLNDPQRVAVDSAGSVYVVDLFNNRIRKISAGVITTVAGGGSSLGDNVAATSAQLANPQDVAFDSSGNLYIISGYRVLKVANGVITTVAGNGDISFGGDDGPATSALLDGPARIALDSSGKLYIADTLNQRIREVANGVIATVAGNGLLGFGGDNGPATSAELNSPMGVVLDADGNLYIADLENRRVRRVSNGTITTVAGTGTPGFSGDNGPATGAQLDEPDGVAVDSSGDLYFTDFSRVRQVSNGIITTVAGTLTFGFGGDDGPATSAQLNGTGGIAVDPSGNLYIVDTGNQRIRKVSNGQITTVAGNGTAGFIGDGGSATSAALNEPSDVAVDSAGNLYIADTGNQRIRKVSNGVITTIAGNGTASFGGDGGPAIEAPLGRPEGIAVDGAGNVYIADTGNNRIRLLTPNTDTCFFSVSPRSLEAGATGENLSVTIQTSPSCAWAVSNLPSWLTVSGATSGSGTATLALVVAHNSGSFRSATIAVAGFSILVTQAAGPTHLRPQPPVHPGGGR